MLNLSNNLKKDNELLCSELLKKFNKCEDKKESYAEKLKSSNTSTVPITVKPIRKQLGDDTKKDLKMKINPSELNVKVNGFRTRNDGRVTIKCVTSKEREILANDIKKKLSDQYIIETPVLRYPKLFISGISEKLENEDLVLAIKNQNNIIVQHIKVLKVYESYKNKKTFNAIVEIDGKAFKQFMKERRINIRWDRCIVYEHLNVMRCYKCWGFNHKASVCKEIDNVCAKCSETGHTHKECKNVFIKCVNCVKAKKTLNLRELSTDHDCRDVMCKTLQRRVKLEAENTNY
ncbi:uncharacterized protein LOC119675767 [Teleopsis dalmanni]|uniref:uncharacterized protein LOC119675767 n=1 Tax=Teleopsis dalmanni TaxID=139649 RepID=UPI0018CFB4D3|nr:uncharacterized protein LOC119675767 [Teleopsis dalmanni]